MLNYRFDIILQLTCDHPTRPLTAFSHLLYLLPLFLRTKTLVSSYLITLNQIILFFFGLLVFPGRSVVSVCLLFPDFRVTVLSVSPVEPSTDTQPE